MMAAAAHEEHYLDEAVAASQGKEPVGAAH